jgi:hypothetical protein
MTPEELMTRYPHLDHMMAETLLWAHENGRLEHALESWSKEPPRPIISSVVKNAITVETPQK